MLLEKPKAMEYKFIHNKQTNKQTNIQKTIASPCTFSLQSDLTCQSGEWAHPMWQEKSLRTPHPLFYMCEGLGMRPICILGVNKGNTRSSTHCSLMVHSVFATATVHPSVRILVNVVLIGNMKIFILHVFCCTREHKSLAFILSDGHLYNIHQWCCIRPVATPPGF